MKLARYLHRIAVAISILCASVIGAPSHMTLSAYALHRRNAFWLNVINTIFRDVRHCYAAYERYVRGGTR